MRKLLLLFGAVTLLFAACTSSTDDGKRNLIDEIANAKAEATIDVEKFDGEVDKKGEYTVNAKGLTITTMKLLEASLTVSEEVADGSFTFKDGELNALAIEGGGTIVIENSTLDTLYIDGGVSVSIENCTIKNLIVKKDGVKVSLSGATKIKTEVKIEADGCMLDADGTSNSIAKITLSASVKKLTIDASDKSSLDISNITVDMPSEGEAAAEVIITVKNPDAINIEKVDEVLKGSIKDDGGAGDGETGGDTGSGSGTGSGETGEGTGSGSGAGSGETGEGTGSGSGNTGDGETGEGTGSGSGTGGGETGGNTGSGSGTGSGTTGGGTGSGSGETGGDTGSGSGNTGGIITKPELKNLYLAGGMNTTSERDMLVMDEEDSTKQKYTFTYSNTMVAWGGGDGMLQFKVCYGAESDDWSLDWGASDWTSVNLIVNNTEWLELAHRDENNPNPGNIVVKDLLDGEEYTIEIEYDPSTISVKIRMYGKMIDFPNLSFVSVDESGNKVEEFPLERKGTNYTYVFTSEEDGIYQGYFTDGIYYWGADGEAKTSLVDIKYIETERKANKKYKIAAVVDPTNLEKLLEISFGMYITSLYNYDSLAYICSNYGNYKLVWGDEQEDGSYEAAVTIPIGTLNKWGQTDTADIEFGVTKDESWNNKYTNAILTIPDVRYQTEKSVNKNNEIVGVNPSERAVTITVISTEKEIFVKYAQ